MKEDLRRLMDEFLEETKKYRTVKIDKQLTDKMPERFEYERREPTLKDFIVWLNDNID